MKHDIFRVTLSAAIGVFVALMPDAGFAARMNCDVAVVGGGSAGFAAAWSAAKRGADVVLVEREDALGGTSTIGGVSSWEPVCGARGLPEIVYDRLKKEGRAGVYRFAHHCSWPEKDGAPRFPGALLEIDIPVAPKSEGFLQPYNAGPQSPLN